MEIYYIDVPFSLPNDTALCLGYFDGLHKGHQQLIKKARKLGSKLALLTFDQSPQQILKALPSNCLLSSPSRYEILDDLGVDILIVQKIDFAFLEMQAEKFVNDYLHILNPAHIICGYDYRFGHNAQGTPALIAQKFPLTIVAEVADDHGKISSSRIVNSLKEGNIEDVSNCLGRFYSLKGTVEDGFHLGRTIDFPTANIRLDSDYYLPKYGVYAAFVQVKGKQYQGMINIGVHPTVTRLEKPLLEVHILDFHDDIYRETIKIQLVAFIREEKTFASLEELRTQLLEDQKKIKSILRKKA